MAKAGDELSARLMGQTIDDKFVVDALIGEGAMGGVFSARHISLDKRVAIKVMHVDLAHDPMFVARFKREAKAASRLEHPNSIRVHDFGEDKKLGILYLAMELLEGRDLLRVIAEEWPLAPRRVVDILSQTLSALAVAHEMGIVHRDLKPENIMVKSTLDDEGMQMDLVKVCDFGIAKINDPRAFQSGSSKGPLTMSGAVVGTPEYMSPEQGKGDALDFRSDLYSVGVILFHMLTGRVPFEAENAIGVILKHITEDVPMPSSLYAGVDRSLEAICMRAMRKRREERFQGAREMRQALKQAYANLPRPSRAPPIMPTDRIAKAETAATLLDAQAAAEQAVSHTVNGAGTLLASPATTIEHARKPQATPAKPNRILLVAIALAWMGGVVAVGIFVMRARDRSRSDTTVARATATAPAELTIAQSDPLAPLDPPRASTTTPREPLASTASGATSLPPPIAMTSVHAAIAPSARAASSSASPAPIASPSAVPASTPIAAPVVNTPPPAAAPQFDSSHAYVEIGLTNAQGAPDASLRNAIRAAGLASCYRDALKATGTRAGGPASVSLSIDGSGVIRSAILTGDAVSQLPQMNRCIQSRVQAQHIAKVDSAGASGDVWLVFHPE